jgi:hypothetical protein
MAEHTDLVLEVMAARARKATQIAMGMTEAVEAIGSIHSNNKIQILSIRTTLQGFPQQQWRRR